MKTLVLTATASVAFGAAVVHAASMDVDSARSRIQADASATGHDFTCNLEKYTIKASGDTTTHVAAGLDLAWDFNDLKTGDEKRDKEMIKWLGGGKPKGSFKFIKSWSETPTGGSAQGTLTINGVSKVIAFPYTVKQDGDWMTIDGKVTIDYQNFKLEIVRAMAIMTVDPKLAIRFHVVGKVK